MNSTKEKCKCKGIFFMEKNTLLKFVSNDLASEKKTKIILAGNGSAGHTVLH